MAWEFLQPSEFRRILEILHKADVRFIVIGGIAAIINGLVRSTADVDVVYARDKENLSRLAFALEPYHPYLRGAPEGLPFRLDAETLHAGLNFTLTTDLGALDLLGDVAGGGSYEELLPFSFEDTTVFGFPCHCVGLQKLIHLKRAAGRPKDFEAVAQLEAVLEERMKRAGNP